MNAKVKKFLVFGSALVAASVLLAGCGGGGGSGSGGSSSSGGGACGSECGPNTTPTGLMLEVSASPVPADGLTDVVVAVSKVELTGPSGSVTIPVGPPDGSGMPVDFLKPQGMVATMLTTGSYGVQAGNYTSLVLTVVSGANSDYVMSSDGGQYPLVVPPTITVDQPVDLRAGQSPSYDLYVDLPRDLAVTTGSGGVPVYTLTVESPRLTNQADDGMLSGSVAATTTIGGQSVSAPPVLMPDGSMSGCDPVVYLYQGSVTALDGYDVQVSGGAQVYESAVVTLNNGGAYAYNFPPLPAGTYTVALTCASADKAGATTLAFSTPKTVTVTAQTDEQVNW